MPNIVYKKGLSQFLMWFLLIGKYDFIYNSKDDYKLQTQKFNLQCLVILIKYHFRNT